MVKRILSIIALLCLASSAAAAADVRSFVAFDTGAVVADGWTHTATWPNNQGFPIYIRLSKIWMGMDMGGRGDFWAKLIRASDGSVIDFTNWDHYAEPTTVQHFLQQDFQPNYMLLAPGDSLILDYGSNASHSYHIQVVVQIWWTAGS